MQWNRVNMSKDELKRKQDKYIKEAIEASKKATITEDIPTTVIISVPDQSEIEIDEPEKAEEVVSREITSSEETVNTPELNGNNTIDTTASEEIKDNYSEEVNPEKIFENVFITEEEAEQKLLDAELSMKEYTEKAPDFESYINNHNNRSENKSSDKFADE